MAHTVPTLPYDVQNALHTIIATQNIQLWGSILPLLVAHVDKLGQAVLDQEDTKTASKEGDFASRIAEKKLAVLTQLQRFPKNPPFTVLRIAELLVDPLKEGYVLDSQSRVLKYLNSLAKTVLVSSSVGQFPQVQFGVERDTVATPAAPLVPIPWLSENQTEKGSEGENGGSENGAKKRHDSTTNDVLKKDNKPENGDTVCDHEDRTRIGKNGLDSAEATTTSNGDDRLSLDPMVLTPPLPNAQPLSPTRRPRDEENDHEDKKRRKNDRLGSDDDGMAVSHITLNSSPAALATPTGSFEDHEEANKSSDSETPLNDRGHVSSDRILVDEEPLQN